MGSEKGSVSFVSPWKILSVLALIYSTALAIGCAIVYGGRNKQTYPTQQNCDIPAESGYPFNIEHLGLAFSDGLSRQKQIESSVLVITAFIYILVSTSISSLTVIFHPRVTPFDFTTKGTLSNVSQDVTTSRGRLFTAGLSLACLLSMVSQYTSWIYRSWIPHLKFPF